MKKIIAACLLIGAYGSSYSQDAPKVKNQTLPPKVTNYGPYTVTINDGKLTTTKNPNFDASKLLKRDTARKSRSFGTTTEIYLPDVKSPVVKKYFIYDLNSISSERMMPKEERMAKYNSRNGVNIVNLKPGVIPVGLADLLRLFGVSKRNATLPLFIDYKPVSTPADLAAIPEAVLKIEVINDTDGFKFLNIVTKAKDMERQKFSGKDIISIR